MRILSIGTDRKILQEGSEARIRQEAYAREFGNLDLIVFSLASHEQGQKYGYKSKSDAFRFIAVFPTQSLSRLLYGFDAIRIARNLPRPDVVSVQDPFETGFAGLLIARMLGVPLHVQVHTDFTSLAFRPHSLLNRVRYHLAWFVLRRATRIRVVLDRTKDALVARCITAPITVLPIFVDVARFANIARVKHPRFKIALFFIGRLEPEKHPCLAIDALALLRKAGHDAGLTIVGEGGERELLEQRARRLGLDRFVEFVSWQRDITSFLSQADIVLVPSRYEGYGMAIVEALATGVPVIATDVGCAREAGAIVVQEKDFPAALVRWASSGPRQATLAEYPYRDFEEYVRALTDDIRACARA
jgi:glycosyltransferase involved in cell wall biosynthesis